MNDECSGNDSAQALAEAHQRLRIAYNELDEASCSRLLAVELRRENDAMKAELDACYREISELVTRFEALDQTKGAMAPISGNVWPGDGKPRSGTGWVARLVSRYRLTQLRKKARRVRRSGLFDVNWYLATYPDVAASRMDPVEHYLLFGAVEGRQFNPYFDVVQYVSRNPEASSDPLGHLLSKRRRG